MKDRRATGVQTADGRRWPFDYVVSAVPLPIFLHMTPDLPVDYRSRLATIDYIGVVCLTLRLRYPLSENFWLNVNDPRVSFNGCIEYTNLNAQVTPDAATILYVPYYVPCNRERFHCSDEQLLRECTDGLAVVNPEFSRDWIVDYAVSRDPYAQAICSTGFAQQVPAHRTPIRNLYLIDSSQLYPADRTVSGSVDLAHEVAQLIAAGCRADRQTSRRGRTMLEG